MRPEEIKYVYDRLPAKSKPQVLPSPPLPPPLLSLLPPLPPPPRQSRFSFPEKNSYLRTAVGFASADAPAPGPVLCCETCVLSPAQASHPSNAYVRATRTMKIQYVGGGDAPIYTSCSPGYLSIRCVPMIQQQKREIAALCTTYSPGYLFVVYPI